MSCGNRYKRVTDFQNSTSVIYSKNHNVEVFYNNGLNEFKTVCINLVSFEDGLGIKVRDVDDYYFNYEAKIDLHKFERMRTEQCLEINFQEIHLQIAELLKDTCNSDTFVKLEVDSHDCKIVFYGKSKIKCIIYLVVELKLTDSREIINEMSANILSLKEKNEHLSKEISCLRRELGTKDMLLKDVYVKKSSMEKEFYKQLDKIYTVTVMEQNKTERMLNNEIERLTKRIQKLLLQIDIVKKGAVLKQESESQLIHSLQNLKLENRNNSSTIDTLKNEIQNLTLTNAKIEKNYTDLKWNCDQKDQQIEELEKQIDELQRDMKEATKIIAQKSRINDEIAKDLVQANQMLVNFNYHYDKMSKESDELKEQLKSKQVTIERQQAKLDGLFLEFTAYKNSFNEEEIARMKTQLVHANERIEELEKQNREAIMLNNVLTKKLSAVEFLENRSPNNFIK